MDTKQFLQVVISADEPGYFCLALGNGSNWLETWYQWPEDIDKIVDHANKAKETANVYFSSYLFKSPQSLKDGVLPSRTIQADLDDADIKQLPKPATVLVETSPGRHQAYWVLDTDEPLPLEEHEALSRKITYSIPLCDRSGWALGRKVRIPNTFNHKYFDGPKAVQVKSISGTYDPDVFEALPEVPQFLIDHYDPDFLENPKGSTELGLELLEKIKDAIPVKVYIAYSYEQPDRSEALWALMCWALKAGLTRAEVFTLAKESANNKFSQLKHRGDQDLAKDVLRAEHTVRSGEDDPRTAVYNILKAQLAPLDRKRQVFSTVLEAMQKHGEFLHTHGGFGWYIRRDVGRPVAVTIMSEHLQALLDLQFGLNPTESEARYVIHGLRSFIANAQENATYASLSHYDKTVPHLLLHSGRKDVMRITQSSVDRVVDGAHNVVFPWTPATEPFTPIMRETIDWGEEIFGNGTRGYGSSVENLSNMTPEQGMALFKVWFMFLLFRNAANTKPIIATFGQPGGGKTFVFKKVYTILYGRHRSVSAVTNVDDFDHATATDPLVVLDNVDTWEKWLPDRLAISAGTSDVIKRKLYTDTDTIVLRRQAVLAVTAHNPKFGREDVADRLLLFSFMRLSHFKSEELILSDLYARRNHIWGAIVKDIQKVLATPVPDAESDVPQFRIEDFARVGMWIANALGCAEAFRSSIEDVKVSQQNFNLEEEGLLVACLVKFVQKNGQQPDKAYTGSELWTKLESYADDQRAFTNLYRNAVVLNKKLSAMQQSLGRVVDIQQDTNATGNRVWTIKRKESA
jgi:hypothetical protein